MMPSCKSITGKMVVMIALVGALSLALQPQNALADTRFGVNRVNMAAQASRA